MFESSCDLDLEDDELLNGVFEDEGENFNFSDRLEGSSIEKGLEPKKKIAHAISFQNEFEEKNGVQRRPKSTSNNTMMVSNSNFAFHSAEPNKNSLVVLKDRENKRKIFEPSPLPKRNKRERKFPGPAGLLPDLKSRGFSNLLENTLEDDELNSNTMGKCSGSVLEEEPWQSLLADLGPHRNILDLINVASVKRKAAARCFVRAKLPFLAAVLHNLDALSPDPCVILRDPTGEIHGTLHREVWDQFGSELVVGSVIVISNAGLLSTGVSCRRHYLNITANNVVTIYSAASLKIFQRSRLQMLTSEALSQIVEKWRKLVPSHSPGIRTPPSVASPRLFNSSLNPRSTTPRTTSVNRTKHPFAGHSSVSDRTRQLHCVGGSSNKSFTPESARGAPVRQPGRNLLRSFSPSSPGPRCPNQSQGQSFLYGNSTPSFSNFPNSHTNNIRQGMIGLSNTSNNSTKVNPVTSNSSNKFDSVVLKPKVFNGAIFPQSNSDREPRTENVASCSQSSIVVNNNTRLVLSQSSQLTYEEQSMVENVFDGIDTDSLFDDDF